MEAIEKKRLLIFGGLAAAFVAVLSVCYFRSRSSAVLTVCMFTPATSVILTRLITHEGTKNLYLLPHFCHNVRWYIGAWLATPAIAYAGAALYFCVFPGDVAFLDSNYAVLLGVSTKEEYLSALLQVIPLAVLFNPVMGILQCLGEEFAWRGYLLPKLAARYSPASAALLTGTVWGIWHAPFIAAGYNYGIEHPVLGVAAMIVLCLVIGSIQAFLFFKTKSIWSAVLFHAAFNGIDLWKPSDLFMARPADPFIGPDLTGILGGAGYILTALICLFFLNKKVRAEQG